jgi:hypothetical protein
VPVLACLHSWPGYQDGAINVIKLAVDWYMIDPQLRYRPATRVLSAEQDPPERT